MASAEVDTTPATVEIADAIFCTHFKEQCDECNFDGREDNDGFFGFDFTDRAPLDCPPGTLNKDGVYQCKKHGSAGQFVAPRSGLVTPKCQCRQCYGWKKQITRARTAAKKAGRSGKN
ncbi:hypothetical protein DFP72DRAFT_989813 [Ephemerocybe angulata]|uniref:Uncharacterized protein n=1 Tax=Ephemerocybe angulata TaxID=980116 RepID=A0A8H6M5H8_9AGAR|nr:hypothetical protein DFP72DRAFT_989813 [Tulosesus angulatus]